MKIALTIEVSDDDLLAIGRAMTDGRYEIKASREQAKAFLEEQGPVVVGDLINRSDRHEAA